MTYMVSVHLQLPVQHMHIHGMQINHSEVQPVLSTIKVKKHLNNLLISSVANPLPTTSPPPLHPRKHTTPHSSRAVIMVMDKGYTMENVEC